MKRLLVLALVLMLLLSVVACGQEVSTSTPPSTAPTNPQDSVGEDAGDTTEVRNEKGEFIVALPLVEGKITISQWAIGPDSSAGMVTQGDSIAYKELERLTNVHIDWVHPVAGQELQQFNLLIASGSCTDVIGVLPAYWTGGIARYNDMGIIHDLTPYIDSMQNYMRKRTITDESLRMTITNENKILFVQMLKEITPASFGGPIVRGDLATQYGIDLSSVKTFNDWYDMLTVFKQTDESIDAPYTMFYTGANSSAGLDSVLMAGYNITPGIYRIGSEVRYGPYTDEFKQYLIMMNKWYSEGLLDSGFNTRSYGEVEPLLLSGKSVASSAMYINIDRYDMITDSTDNPDWTAIEIPTVKANDVFNVQALSSKALPTNQIHVITTACDESYVPIILKMWDYCYTEEGALLWNYGIEGESFYFDDEGEPRYYDFVLNDPDGMSASGGYAKYSILHGTSPGIFDWRREISGLSEKAYPLARDTWDIDFDVHLTPTLDIATDRVDEYSNKLNEVNTFVQEWSVRAIMGQFDIDSEWNSYISEIESMGVKTVLELAQDSYNQYLNRDITAGYTAEQIAEYNIGNN